MCFISSILSACALCNIARMQRTVQGNTDDCAAVAALRAKLAEVMAAADGRTSLALEELLRNVSGDVDVLEKDLLQNNPQIFRRCKVLPLRTQPGITVQYGRKFRASPLQHRYALPLQHRFALPLQHRYAQSAFLAR